MTNRIILIEHGDGPQDDRVFAYLNRNGYDPVVCKPFSGEAIDLDMPLAGAVIYGGKYNVYDTTLHPFLLDEYRFIGHCLARDIPLLGICQGAQQIAWHLGAEVGPDEKGLTEFGYYTLHPSDAAADFLDAPIHVAQAHYHTFALPPGALHLASSDHFPNQAFRIGDRIYGFQFHAEVTPAGFRRWQETLTANYGRPGAQTRDEQDELMRLHDEAQAQWFESFLRKLFPPIGGAKG
jgi:GMP synthase (glutamine-hydrolysing)